MSLAEKLYPPKSKGERLERALNQVYQTEDRLHSETVRCSGLDYDARHWYFRLTQAPGDVIQRDPATIRVLENGTGVHDRLQAHLNTLRQGTPPADPAVQILQVEGYDDTYREVAISDQVRLSGHLDGMVEIEGVRFVLEIKSISPFYWSKLKGPLLGHQWQATGYHRLWGLPTLFCYEDKGTQKWKWFEFYPDALWMSRLEVKLQQIAEAVTRGIPPDFCEQDPETEFNYIIGSCAHCAFQTHCALVGNVSGGH